MSVLDAAPPYGDSANDRGDRMPTPKEYRLRADECLDLMNEANLWYVKTALRKLAAEFQRRAERLERSNESL